MSNLALANHNLYTKVNKVLYSTDIGYIDYSAYKNYDARYETEMCRQENDAIKKLFLSVHKNTVGNRIVDLGCGTGLLLDLSGPHIFQPLYTGIDICGDMIEKAAGKYPFCKFITADAEIAIKEIENQHDIIVSLFSIPYIGTSTLDDVYRILRPGGYFFAVYYRWPFVNPSSVYVDKKEHYITDVLPQVDRFIDKAYQLFKCVYNRKLIADSQAYNVALFQKV